MIVFGRELRAQAVCRTVPAADGCLDAFSSLSAMGESLDCPR